MAAAADRWHSCASLAAIMVKAYQMIGLPLSVSYGGKRVINNLAVFTI